MNELDRLRAVNATLMAVGRWPNLLREEALNDVAIVIHEFVSYFRLVVIIRDPQSGNRRLYGTSRENTTAVVPFGTVLPLNPEIGRRIYVNQEPVYCDDARLGNELERRGAENGAISYVTVPGRVGRGAAREALCEVVFTFSEPGGARLVDYEVLQGMADAIAGGAARARETARERRLAMILDTSGDAMLAWDRQGRITDVNGAAVALTGRPSEELIGARIGELLDPLPDALPDGPDGSENRMELRARGEKGEERRVAVGATLTEVTDDALVAAHALLRDLSHVVEAEREAAQGHQRVRELEERHRALLDNAPLVIFRLQPRSRELVYLNRHAERFFGVPCEEAMRTPSFLRGAHVEPEGAAAFDGAVDRATAGVVALPYVARLRRGQADAVTARATVYPVLSERGQVVGIEGLFIDVSAEQVARTRLVQNDRLATLGTLAAGIAHEINNPAAFILLGLDMLDRLLKGPGMTMDEGTATNATELSRELRDSIKRIVDIARDLRLFASPPAANGGRRTIIDVNRTVESALSLTRGQILERAQIVRNLEDVPPIVMEDGRLGQVVVNLLVNAAQAIPKSYGHEHCVTVASRRRGSAVEIEVRDTGVGIPPENIHRIWQPFFTTKSPEVGTGLGLSISREIVERAGGRIRVESPLDEAIDGAEPGGTRFIIALPVAGSGDFGTPVSAPLPVIPKVRARVLVVEDEPALARALAEELGKLHQVTIASGAEIAKQLLADEDAFDVVLCDLRMPGLSGEAFYTQIRESRPLLAKRFIFMTGVGFGADVERFLKQSGRPVLEKPFSAEDALQAIVKIVVKGHDDY